MLLHLTANHFVYRLTGPRSSYLDFKYLFSAVANLQCTVVNQKTSISLGHYHRPLVASFTPASSIKENLGEMEPGTIIAKQIVNRKWLYT